MSGARRQLELYTRLNTELVAMIDHFSALVRATKEGLDADEAQPGRPDSAAAGGAATARERRVPGELLEVSVEKLLAAGHQCVHTVSELKKGAILSDMASLLATVNGLNADLASDSRGIEGGLGAVRREAEGLLVRLESHYYSSGHKPAEQPPWAPHPVAASLSELCGQALQMMGDMREGPAAREQQQAHAPP